MNEEIKREIERARELFQELKTECEKRMLETSVHPRILNLAVEVLGKLRGVLDHTAYIIFESKMSPKLGATETKKTKVYFPIVDDEQNFRSRLENSKFLGLETESPATYKILRDAQPFPSSSNEWLATLRNLSNVGKHVHLVRQVRQVTRRTTVTGPTGSVTWGEGVTFGQGVSIMGAPVDPRTKNIMPTPGVQSKVEHIISFEFPDAGVNALGFLDETIVKVQNLVTEVLKTV